MTTLQPPRNKELEALSVKAARVFVDAGLHGIEAEVVVVLDTSPRMAPLWLDGSLQRIVSALMALAMKFDDDGVVPVWTFADEARLVGKMRREDYLVWVAEQLEPPPLMRPGMKLPPSRYAPFIDAIAQRWFPREWATPPVTHQVGDRLKRFIHQYASLIEPRECPIFVIVVTSGDCDDPMETSKLLRRASHLPIFWQFAAVNTTEGQAPEFRFLRGLDKLTDTHVDSCGFFMADDFRDADRLFSGLLGEFQRYVEHPLVRAMLVGPAIDEPSNDSGERVVQDLLKLPPNEAARREHARAERERRRAERERASAVEIARADAWPQVRPAAEHAHDDDHGNEDEHEPAEPSVVVKPATRPQPRPQPRVQLETQRYAPSTRPTPAAPLAPSTPPTPSSAARRPQPPPRSTPAPEPLPEPEAVASRPLTRTFERVQAPSAPAPEPDPEDSEDTVETAAERLQRIRARREARKGTS